MSREPRELYDRLIGPLREVAREAGYALAVHGSIARDIDLVAVPWVEASASPVALAAAIGRKASEIVGQAFMIPQETGDYFRSGCPGGKPHGRLCWPLHLGGGAYLDLSVIPPRPAEPMGHNWPLDFDSLEKLEATAWIDGEAIGDMPATPDQPRRER